LSLFEFYNGVVMAIRGGWAAIPRNQGVPGQYGFHAKT
jgi:hypothetical protein